MKFLELRENEPPNVMEVSKYLQRTTFELEKSDNKDIVEFKQIQMRIFSDGELEKSEEISQKIEEYYIGKRKYQYEVDTVKTKNILKEL